LPWDIAVGGEALDIDVFFFVEEEEIVKEGGGEKKT
jgi:hypothetical protein